MSYKVESDFYHVGLRCVVIMLDRGYRCGYVGIPKEHPLYGISYSQKHELLKKTDIENKPIGNRGILPLFIAGLKNDLENLSPDIYFDVHGSITYANNDEEYPVENKDNLWWFGYDCNHSGDAPDLDFMSEKRKKYYNPYFNRNGVVRSLNYCISECKKLAEQLSKFMLEEQREAGINHV